MASKPKATRSTTRAKATVNPDPPAQARATRAVSKSAAAAPPTQTTRKTSSRKPLINRDNSPDKTPVRNATKPKAVAKPLSASEPSPDTDREPIKAFLRIRPRTDDAEAGYEPYLDPLSDSSVRMTDPSSSTGHSRLSSVNPTSIYHFTHVFPPETTQSDFFSHTTLPLVRDVLEGRNGLLFAYGVTNSGKTHTIQGGAEQGSAGIIPRTLDVVFNSIDGLHGDGMYRPVRLQGIELASESDEPSTVRLPTKPGATALGDVLEEDLPASASSSTDTDPTVLTLDRNYEHTIWLSYAEVYNEKVYDLFSALESGQTPSTPQASSGIPPSPLLLTRKALTVKPSPAGDGDGDSTPGKYVAGLRQIHVRSATEAKELLRIGQLHRRVFGTLANSQSSRSHALVTIKVLRVHRGERNDPTSIQTARLTLVDLAGSERTKHTHTSGERLREAGNINKSLMVLGQCMETLRANQRTLARSLQQPVKAGTHSDTRDVKRGLAVVPFRHSKLTEVLMDYFVGDGRAVMIVNVNPYDTGFDENVHVMKFSALAREVSTNPAAVAARTLPSPTKPSANARQASGAYRRKVTLSLGGPGRKASEAHLEVLEEDEEVDDGDETSVEDDEPINPLVNALFDEVEALRMQLYDVNLRCALIEAETREEVMVEMEERMQKMEDAFTKRLMRVVRRSSAFQTRSATLIHHGMARSEGGYSDSVADSDVGPLRMSDVGEGEFDDVASSVAGRDADNESDSDGFVRSSGTRSRTPSPLAKKGKPRPMRQSMLKAAMHDVEEDELLSDDDLDDDDDDDEEVGVSISEDRHGDEAVSSEDEDEDEWSNSEDSESTPAKTARARPRNNAPCGGEGETGRAHDGRSPDIALAGPGAEYVPKKGEVDGGKKKKR
ncbi:kinesin-domain-containing protein [Epithele typhae]|uniref:kinesin-domain-containing protein n=1 Tax=Epithele typhae TaxID=378194 RepID=UPI002007640C|nr:kinesin-domain-containing protein [Epithele typhae]KAH9912258.1 kinesin-domain-containing protein [Epithele typhae]